mmetsp:Transcript_9260/g.8276  ORF Transcript_9260/g.8276 Transcript_9260/m.8276 type:complete len:191 (-) Transcript_9260:91-663(-)
MGQSLTCECFEGALGSGGNAVKERLAILHKGNKFMRSAYLGLASQELTVKLSEDCSKIEWKVVSKTWTGDQYGEIDLTKQVKTIKLVGKQGMQFISSLEENKVIFEITADEPQIRDQWVLTINELLQDWIDHPEHKPQSSLTATGTSNKNEYFKKREEEIAIREKEAQERKAKFGTQGMKFTAQVMASRP